MLRWGILTDGSAASIAPAMRSSGADLAIIASSSLSRAQAFASEQGVRRARGEFTDVLEANDVDAVFVALDPSQRERWIVQALQAGKHVLSAAPMATDADTAGRLAAAAAGAGRVLMEATAVRFHPRTDALLDLVRGGEIGDVRLCTLTTATDDPDADLISLAQPAVSVLRWLLADEPDRVAARCARHGLVAALTFPSGTLATLSAVLAAGFEALDVVGTRASVRVPRPLTATRAHDAAIEVNGEAVGSWRADPAVRMLNAFGDAVAGGFAILPADDAVSTAAVLDAIRVSGGL